MVFIKKNKETILNYGAKAKIFQNAEKLRQNMTETEKLLWEKLKGNKLKGYKFRRQHPIDIFIVDFYCHKAKLVIEIDGEIHNRREIKEYDENRTYEIEQYGLKVIRFTNEEVLENIESVINKISNYLN